MRIATWNINGIKARIEGLTAWLQQTKPDLVCLQEIKTVNDGFPVEAMNALGYNCAVHGEKGFNGVAILARAPLEDIRRGLPGDATDAQARYLEAVVSVPRGSVRVASLYLPNGNPIGTDKFAYKCAWMERLITHARALRAFEEPVVLAGDYNIIPEPLDARQPQAWANDALFQPEARSAWRRLCNEGYVDAVRACHPEPHHYTFWDYQAGAWQKDNGIRIDHLTLSPEAADRLRGAGIDRFTRSWEKPADHVPVWIDLTV